MKMYYFFIAYLALSAQLAGAQSPKFNRYTDVLNASLEKDTVNALATVTAFETTKHLCKRLGGSLSQIVEIEVAEWNKRNAIYVRGFARAMNEFGDLYKSDGGEATKQEYLKMILYSSSNAATARLAYQLEGYSVDNSAPPPEKFCFGFARWLQDGIGDFERKPDQFRALRSYTENSASAASENGDSKTDLAALTARAESGDVDALGNLANAYAFGRGVEKDLPKAYGLWFRAAEKHLGTAMFNIAVLYATGQGGLPKDQSQAAIWYKKAAEHRHDQAMITLSSIYATGQGLEKDKQLAIAWASLASTNSKSEQLRNTSLNQLHQLTSGMSKDEIAEIQKIMSQLAVTIDENVGRYRNQ